jgi:type I restriction enzyme M protein
MLPILRHTSSLIFFFKRISDIYDEEFALAMDESSGDSDYASFPEKPSLSNPGKLSLARHTRKNREYRSGVTIRFSRNRESNPRTLYGIFGDAQWTNREGFPIAC